jgi:hypothetical protein
MPNPLENLSPVELEFTLRGELARKSFDIDGYAHFHWCVFNKELVRHSRRMVERMFKAWNKPDDAGLRGVLNKASRGFTKSVEGTGFIAFAIGHFPHLSHVMIAARDRDSKRLSEFISDLIATNIGWKACFPYVVPDKERGWSLDGGQVKDTRVPYEQWVKTTMDDHMRDPSFIAVTVNGGARGLHPTGVLMMDDVHDEENSSSKAEKEQVKAKVKDDILPTMSRAGRKPMLLSNYTPLSMDDANIEILEGSGIFDLVVTPAFVDVSDVKCPNCGVELHVLTGRPDNVVYPYICECNKLLRKYAVYEDLLVELTWWEQFTPEVLTGWRKILGRRNFARAFLLDLQRGKTVGLPYYAYTFENDTSLNWPMKGGCDPTQFVREAHKDASERSHFALAYVGQDPKGGLVVVGGLLAQCSQLEAENYILAAQDKFKGWQHTLVEEAGTGRMFIDVCGRNPALAGKVIGSDLYFLDRKGRVKSKEDRFEKDAAKWFENMTVRVNSADTEFLNAVRYGLDHFFELDKHNKAKDALDAVYHALKGFPEALRFEAFTEESISREPETVARINPLAIGQHWRGYGRKNS